MFDICFISTLFKVPASDIIISSAGAGCAAKAVVPEIISLLSFAAVIAFAFIPAVTTALSAILAAVIASAAILPVVIFKSAICAVSIEPST